MEQLVRGAGTRFLYSPTDHLSACSNSLAGCASR